MTGQPLQGGGQPPRQYQQPQGYGAAGPAGYGPYPPPAGYPQRKSTNGTAKLVVAIVGIVAVLSAGGLGLHFLLSSAVEPNAEPVANPPQAPAPAPSSGPATATRPPTSTSRVEPSYLPDVEATIPGWQPVADSRTSVAYDVPGDWKVESPTVLVGFEDESGPRVAMHAVATYKDDACANVRGSYRGRTGIMGNRMEGIKPRQAAEAGALLWAAAAAEVPTDDPSIPTPEAKRISLDGDLEAWRATVTITPPEDGDCAAPKLRFTTVSFTPRDGGGVVLFVMYTDLGVPDALPGDVANKIISTLRPVD